MDTTIVTHTPPDGKHRCILTDGERDILDELNEDAYADALAEWDDLTEEEQEAATDMARKEVEAPEREAGEFWAAMDELALQTCQDEYWQACA